MLFFRRQRTAVDRVAHNLDQCPCGELGRNVQTGSRRESEMKVISRVEQHLFHSCRTVYVRLPYGRVCPNRTSRPMVW